MRYSADVITKLIRALSVWTRKNWIGMEIKVILPPCTVQSWLPGESCTVVKWCWKKKTTQKKHKAGSKSETSRAFFKQKYKKLSLSYQKTTEENKQEIIWSWKKMSNTCRIFSGRHNKDSIWNSPVYLDKNWGHTFPYLIQEWSAIRHTWRGSGVYPPCLLLTWLQV